MSNEFQKFKYSKIKAFLWIYYIWIFKFKLFLYSILLGYQNLGIFYLFRIWCKWNKYVHLTLGARSHILIKILKDYYKDFGALFTIFLLKIFERFLKYFCNISSQNIQKLWDQIILINISVYFYKNIDKVFEKICKSYCK